MKPTRLTDEELAFQTDDANWRSAPTLDMRFFCDPDLDYSLFKRAVRNDPMVVHDARFDHPDRVILWDESWPTLLGAWYYDFDQRDRDRREPSLVFYPRQYKRLAGDDVKYAPPVPDIEERVAMLVYPLVDLALRIRDQVDAERVYVFTEDEYPSESYRSEIRPRVFLGPTWTRVLRW